MAVGELRRPLRFLRRDSTYANVGAGGTVTGGAPSYGRTVVTIYMSLAQAGTLVVYQRLRANSTFAAVGTYPLAAAGVVSTSVQITGEHVEVIFTNGGVAQKPELLIGLA